ncbi:MAG: hypothetical protein KDA41_16640 [Planctomycetales bacterium]|nr:hypothetical protein [Planctomycetales bacterium]
MADRYVLEPFAENRKAALDLSDQDAALLSLAISAKRLADTLESVVDPSYDLPAIRTRENR